MLQTATYLLRGEKSLDWLHHRGRGQREGPGSSCGRARSGETTVCAGAEDGDSQGPINILDVSGGSPLGQGPATTNQGQGIFVGVRLRYPMRDPQWVYAAPRASVRAPGGKKRPTAGVKSQSFDTPLKGFPEAIP